MVFDPDKFLMEESNFLKLAFVRVLQVVFSDPSMPPQYHYDEIREKRQLANFRAYPSRTMPAGPCIIVEAATGDVSITSLGEEIVEQEWDTVDKKKLLANIYGGPVFIPVRLTILAKKTTDRDIITDLVGGYIRYGARQLFAANNIQYLDIRSGEDGEEGEGTNKRFRGKVDIKVQSEYKQRIDMSLKARITKINLSEIRYAVAGSAELPVSLKDDEG